MSAAYSIFMTLLAFSIGGWWIVLFSGEAKPIRDAIHGIFRTPGRPDGLNEKLLFGSMLAAVVWAITPSILVSNKAAIADALGMTKHPLWGVALSCIASSIVLGIVGPIAWYFVRQGNPEDEPPGSSDVHQPNVPTVTLIAKQEPGIKQVQYNCSNGVRGFMLAAFPVTAVVFATSHLRTNAQHPLLKLLTDVPGPTTIGLVLLAAVVLAPLVEELLFRVLLQGFLQSFLRPWVAIVVVAAGFSAVHGWPNMLPLFPLALVLGTLFYLTRSYLAVVVTHLLFNLTNVVMTVISAS